MMKSYQAEKKNAQYHRHFWNALNMILLVKGITTSRHLVSFYTSARL
jgi:hypothetical protein